LLHTGNLYGDAKSIHAQKSLIDIEAVPRLDSQASREHASDTETLPNANTF